jgi:hypothetical protein
MKGNISIFIFSVLAGLVLFATNIEAQQNLPPQVKIIQPVNGSVFDGGQIMVVL